MAKGYIILGNEKIKTQITLGEAEKEVKEIEKILNNAEKMYVYGNKATIEDFSKLTNEINEIFGQGEIVGWGFFKRIWRGVKRTWHRIKRRVGSWWSSLK